MKSIPLTMGQVALVDDADYEWLSQWKWQAMKASNGGHYACRADRSGGKERRVLMHREVAGAFGAVQVDHINLNKLDNQRLNLRLCSHAENMRNLGRPRHNTSGYKGVSFHKPTGRWRASIDAHCKQRHLGMFDSKIAAAIAYNIAAVQLHGEFARLNDVFSGELA